MAGLARGEHPVGFDREGAARAVEAEDPDQLLVDVELPARDAERAGDGEEEALICVGIAKDRVEHAREQRSTTEAAGLDLSRTTEAGGHVPSMRSATRRLNGTDGPPLALDHRTFSR